MASSSMNCLPSVPAIVSADSCGKDFIGVEKSFIRRPAASTSLHWNASIHGFVSMDNRSRTNDPKPNSLCGYGGDGYAMEEKTILRRPATLWSGKRMGTSLCRNTMRHNAISMERFKATSVQVFKFCGYGGNSPRMERDFFKQHTRWMSRKLPRTSLQRTCMLYSCINAERIRKNSLHALALSSSSSSSSSTPSSSLDASQTEFPYTETMETPGPDEKTSLKGIFPGDLRRAEVKLPGLAIKIRVIDILGPESKEFQDVVDSMIATGFTMVILQSRGEGCEDGGSAGGARLFEAARLLKSLLRGRATLLVEERVDIASAAGADGVLISDEGLPAVVARSMMQNVNSESLVLPLIARSVTSPQSALLATTSEGADFLLVQTQQDDLANIISTVSGRVSIPVFSQESMSSVSLGGTCFKSLEAGATGIVYNAIDLKSLTADQRRTLTSSLLDAMTRAQSKAADISRSAVNDLQELSDLGTARKPSSMEKKSLDLQVMEILDEERSVLESLIILMKEAYPEMEEVSLLIDAVTQLDEPFLLMVVGEFNSGKSSVINALLGKRYLAEGVLPTTNEIALLKHADAGVNKKERSERHPDGHFMYYLPAELLKEINIVDTPGTNVILKRQQKLTEEFLPRADLVLFVLSADRPFTESEMVFLRYIRQWDKKIIFLLNKSDIYLDTKELEEVVKFVQDNAQQILSLEQTTIYAVSARQAFQAKTAVINSYGTLNTEQLQKNTTWNSSGFQKLEDFITDFLGGSSEAGAERRRLKLTTPLGISLTLLEVCDRQLSMESKKASSDVEALQGLLKQLDDYQKAMESNGSMDRQQLFALVEAAKVRADRFVDSVLRVSNIDAVASYLLGGDRTGTLPVAGSFDEQVLGSVLADVKRLLERHSTSLENSLKQQVNSYRELLMNRWPNVNLKIKYTGQDIDKYKYSHPIKPLERVSIRVLDGFDTQAAKIVLEQELRDVVFSTFSGLGVAGVSASVLTSILPNTVEDLLALALCSAGGLVGVWNLPNRRSEVKRKVKKVADAVANQISVAMEADVRDTIAQLRKEVEEIMEPYIESAQTEADRVRELQARVEMGKEQLEQLRMRVQNIRC